MTRESGDGKASPRDHEQPAERGQLVLVAAAVIAVALAPVVFAHLQLGYHADVRASADYDAPARNAQRLLERAVHEAAVGVSAGYSWTERGAAVDAVRDRLRPRLETLAASRVAEGTVYATAYNESAAREWAAANCPGGPNRQFGPCEADRGVVTQERVGETHVLAVAFDIRVTTDRGRIELTLVVRAVGGG